GSQVVTGTPLGVTDRLDPRFQVGILLQQVFLPLGRGRYVVGESVGGLHHSFGGGHTLHDLGGDVVALGVTLYRNGDELTSCGGGRDASVLAGKGDHTGGEIGFGGGAVHLPGPVHRKSELPGQELFPHRVLGVVEHRV